MDIYGIYGCVIWQLVIQLLKRSQRDGNGNDRLPLGRKSSGNHQNSHRRPLWPLAFKSYAEFIAVNLFPHVKPALTHKFACKQTDHIYIYVYTHYSKRTLLYTRKNILARQKDTAHKIETPKFYLDTHSPPKTQTTRTQHDKKTSTQSQKNIWKQKKKTQSQNQIPRLNSHVFGSFLPVATAVSEKAQGLLCGDSGSLVFMVEEPPMGRCIGKNHGKSHDYGWFIYKLKCHGWCDWTISWMVYLYVMVY